MPIQYDGMGTLYLSGTLTVDNTMLCAGVSGTACDYSHWDPNNEMLAMVTGNMGGQPADNAVTVNNSDFQGALWWAGTIEPDTHSIVQGPMVAPQEIFENTVPRRLPVDPEGARRHPGERVMTTSRIRRATTRAKFFSPRLPAPILTPWTSPSPPSSSRPGSLSGAF